MRCMRGLLWVLGALLFIGGGAAYAACSAAFTWPYEPTNSLVINTSAYTEVSCAPNSSERTAVIIVIGQSLTANSVAGSYSPTHSKNQQLNVYDGKCYVAKSLALGIGASQQSWAYNRLADMLIDRDAYDRVIMVPMGIGGTSIGQWANTTSPPWLGRRIANVACMLSSVGLTPTYIIWSQGQTDNINNTAPATYSANLRTIVGLFRSAGVNAKFLVNLDTWNAGVPSAAIRGAQSAVVGVNNVALGANIDSLGAAYRYDNTHLNAAGATAVAKMLADIIVPVAPAPIPAPTPTPTPAPSPVGTASSVLFKPTGRLGASNGATTGLSFRQVITPSAVPYSRVRVTLQSGNTTGLSCAHVSVGVQSSGANTKSQPVELTFNGNAGFGQLPVGGSINSDWLTFPVALGDALVIICDGNPAKSSDAALAYGQPLNVGVWWKGSTQSYNLSSVSGFNNIAGVVWGVAQVNGY